MLVGHTDNIRAIVLSEVYVLFSSSDSHPHFLRKQLLAASADGVSASHVKVKISLMTGQPQVLVSHLAALLAYVYTPYRLCLGALLIASVARDLLLGRQV